MSQKQCWIWPLYPLKPRHWGNRLWTDDGTPPGQAVEVSIMSVYQRALPGGPPEKSHKSIEKFYIPTDDDLALMRQCYPQNDPQEPDWDSVKADLIALRHGKATLERSTALAVLHKLREAFCCQLRQVNLPPGNVSWTLPKVIEAVKSIRELAGELQRPLVETSIRSYIYRVGKIMFPSYREPLAHAQLILTERKQDRFIDFVNWLGHLIHESGGNPRTVASDPQCPINPEAVRKCAGSLVIACDDLLAILEPGQAAQASPPAGESDGGNSVAGDNAMQSILEKILAAAPNPLRLTDDEMAKLSAYLKTHQQIKSASAMQRAQRGDLAERERLAQDDAKWAAWECTLEYNLELRKAASRQSDVEQDAQTNAKSAGEPGNPRPPAEDKPDNGIKKEELALAVLVKHPEWTDTRIAQEIGCSRSSLYRMEKYLKARQTMKVGKERIPKARRDIRTGNLLAQDNDPDED